MPFLWLEPNELFFRPVRRPAANQGLAFGKDLRKRRSLGLWRAQSVIRRGSDIRQGREMEMAVDHAWWHLLMHEDCGLIVCDIEMQEAVMMSIVKLQPHGGYGTMDFEYFLPPHNNFPLDCHKCLPSSFTQTNICCSFSVFTITMENWLSNGIVLPEACPSAPIFLLFIFAILLLVIHYCITFQISFLFSVYFN